MGGWNRGLTRNEHPTLARWSLERAGRHYSPATEIAQGVRISPATEFRPGLVPWNRGHYIPRSRRVRPAPAMFPSAELSYIAGVLLGDGCVYIQRRRERGRRTFGGRYWAILSTVERRFADSFASALESIGLHATRQQTKTRGKRKPQFQVIACNKLFCEWFKNPSLDRLESYLRGFESDFVRGFYDSEGGLIRGRYFEITNTEEDLIDLVQRLLGRIGVRSTKWGPYRNGAYRSAWKLYIPSAEGRLFRQVVRPTIKGGGASCE